MWLSPTGLTHVRCKYSGCMVQVSRPPVSHENVVLVKPLQSAEGLPGRAAVLLKLRKLRLWNMQVKVRSLLEREEEEICNMPDKMYKEFQKRTVK